MKFVLTASWIALVVGLVLGGIAIGLISTAAAVLGYTAGVVVVIGVVGLVAVAQEGTESNDQQAGE